MVDTEQPEYSKQFLKILWEYQLFRVFETERLRKPKFSKATKSFLFRKATLQLRTAVKPVEVSVGFHCVRRKSWLICSKIDPKRKHQRKSQFTDCNYTLTWQFLVILHWYACGVDGRADVRSRDYQNF